VTPLDAIESPGKPNSNWQADGKFIKGHSIRSPGRPKGSLDWRTEIKRFAKENHIPEKSVLDAAIRGLIKGSLKGDSSSCKQVIDRYCGILEKGSEVNVGVGIGMEVQVNNQEQVLPPRRELAVQLLEMQETAAQILGSEDEIDALLE
jgi:hypothetical protein